MLLLLIFLAVLGAPTGAQAASGVSVTPDGAPAAPASPSTANEAVFTVANTGDAATAMTVTTTPAAGLSISGFRHAGTTYADHQELNAALAAAPVAAGQSTTVTVFYTVAAGRGGQPLQLQLAARTADELATDTGSFTVTPTGPGMTVSSPAQVAPASPSTGNELTFALTTTGTTTETYEVTSTSTEWLSITGYRLGFNTYVSQSELNMALAMSPVAPGESLDVTVVYTVAHGLGGRTQQLTLAAASTSSGGVSSSRTTLVQPPVVAGVSVTPDGGTTTRRMEEHTQFTQTFQVTNTGNAPDTFDAVASSSDPTVVEVVSGAQAVTLNPTETATVDVVYYVRGGVPGPGTETLTLRATSRAVPDISDTGLYTITVRRPRVETEVVAVDAGGDPLPDDTVLESGDQVRYRVRLTNTGTDDAQTITTQLTLPDRQSFASSTPDAAGWTFDGSRAELAALAPGATRSFTAVAFASSGPDVDDPEDAPVTATAQTTYRDRGTTAYPASSGSDSTRNGFVPGVEVTTPDAVRAVAPSAGNVAWFTVVNAGNGDDRFAVTATGGDDDVTITGFRLGTTDYASLGALNAALDGQSVPAGASVAVGVVYGVGSLAAGVVAEETLSLAALSARSGYATTDDAATAVTAKRPGAAVAAVTPASTRLAGSSGTADLTVQNTGLVEDTLTLTATAGGALAAITTIDGVPGATGAVTLDPGETETITVGYTVKPDAARLAPGSVGLTAASGFDATQSASAAVAVTVGRPVLTLDVAPLRADGTTPIGAGEPVAPGETIRYRVTVRNTGDLPASGISVSSTPPAGQTVTAREGDGWQFAGGVATRDPLAPDGESTFTVVATAGPGAEGAAAEHGFAAAYRNTDDGAYPAVAAAATTTTGFVAGPQVVAPAEAAPDEGDEAELTFTLRNGGNGEDGVRATAIDAGPGLTVAGLRYGGSTYSTLAALNAALAADDLPAGAERSLGVRYVAAAGTAGTARTLEVAVASSRTPDVTAKAVGTVRPRQAPRGPAPPLPPAPAAPPRADPPAGQPPVQQPAPLRLTATLGKRVRLQAIGLRVVCSRACTATVQPTLGVGRARTRLAARTVRLAAGRRGGVRIVLPAASARRVRAALAAGRRPVLRIAVAAVTADGVRQTATVSARLTR